MTARTARFVRVVAALGGVAALALTTACGHSRALDLAESGDREELAEVLAEESKNGTLDEDDAREIARAVARRDIAAFMSPEDVDRVRQFGSCARLLDGALADRQDQKDDDVAAAIAMLRLELDLVDDDEFHSLASDARPAWRAVGARSLTEAGGELSERRRELIMDGDERVRLGALRAAEEALDPQDKELVVDAMRNDPLPLARTVATRAAGGLGGEDIVLSLKDRWARASAEDRDAIAAAWAKPASLETGGRKQLMWAVASEKGSPAIAAAVELMRAGGAGAGEAEAVLARSIDEGPEKDRIFAISAAPDSPLVREALLAVDDKQPPRVRISALRRVATSMPPKREAAVKALMSMAKEKGPYAWAAVEALAQAHVDAAIKPLLKAREAEQPAKRRSAGRLLTSMGHLTDAIVLVADPEQTVRDAVSCAIVRAR